MPYKDKDKQREWAAANRERRQRYAADWYARNRDSQIAKATARNQASGEQRAEYMRAYYQRKRADGSLWMDPAVARAWAKENGWKRCASQAARRARHVPWADQDSIRAVYAVAGAWRASGECAVVDHVIPLKGRAVSGLHVPENLTVMYASQNASKGNKFP